MNKELKINISVNKKTGAIKSVDEEFKQLGKTTKKNTSFLETYGKSLLGLAAGVSIVYALKEAFTFLAGTGIKVNREMQGLNNSLATLQVITSSNITTTGQHLTLTEKYNIAQLKAVETQKRLLAINSKTPHTLNQTVKLYDSMYIGFRKLGAAEHEMIDITKKLSIAVGTKIGFEAMLSAMDGLSTGTVEANSEMGRFLKAIGLSNEEIKESTDVIGLFNNRLSDLKAIDSFDTKVSNLTNSFNLFAKTASKPLFDNLEKNLNPLSKLLDRLQLGAKIVNAKWGNVSNLDDKNDLILRRRKLVKDRKEIKDDKFMYDSDQKRQIAEIDKDLLTISNKLTGIFTAESTEFLSKFDKTSIEKDIVNQLDPYSVKLDEINQKWKSHYKIMNANGEDTSSLINAWSNELELLNKKEIKVQDLSKKFDSHVDGYYKLKDEYKDITNSLVITDDNFINKLGEKYESIALKLEATGMSTNSDWEKLSKAYNKEYFDNSAKEQKSNLEEIVRVVSLFSSEIKEVSTILVDSLYDGIKNKYESSIDTYSKKENDNSLRATIASSFGQNGQALKYDYQKQLNSIRKQEATNNMNYDLSSDAKDYKKTLQSIMEASGIAYSAIAGLGTALGGSGALDGIKFALNASKTADDITSFTKFQTAYIDGVKTYKEQLISLTETLVGTAATMYDSMKTYQDFYDRLNGNQYENLRKAKAYNVLSSYTDVTTENISELISDVLKAQSSFITEGIDLAGSNNEDALKSIDLFDKYGLAFDSLDERFLGSIDTITSLMEATSIANSKIKDFAKSLRSSLTGTNYENEYKQTTQLDFVKALSDYRKGDIDSSQLISIAKTFEGTIADSNNEMRLSLINELEGISEVSTEDYLKNLVSNVDQMMLTGLPVVNIKEAQSVEAQTLDAVTDTNSLLEKMLEILKNPFGSAINIFDEILKVLKEIFTGIFDAARSIVKGIVDAIKDLVDGIAGGASGIVGGIVGGVSSGWSSVKKSFGFSEGGFTGVGGVNEVAGVVHKGEYVIPHWMLEADTGLYSTLENIRQGNNQKYTPSSPVINTTYSNNTDSQVLEDILERLESIDGNSKVTATKLQSYERERKTLRLQGAAS